MAATLEYGSLKVTDPRDSSKVYPWTVKVYLSAADDRIDFEVTGIPYTGPSAT